jgi:hypothetical protein
MTPVTNGEESQEWPRHQMATQQNGGLRGIQKKLTDLRLGLAPWQDGL